MQVRYWKYLFGLLGLALAALVISVTQLPDSGLHIIACDVGQGDAVLVSLASVQILTDGGPDKSVLTCLGRHMPFWDREIELVISTHPDADHATGLIYVLQNYKVDKILINPINPGTQVYQALEKEVGGRGVGVINPVSGMEVRLGLMHLDILGPTREDFNRLIVKNEGSTLSKYGISGATNMYSIIYKLSFKKFTALLPGDMPSEVSDKLTRNWSMGAADYIKIPHHGSNNGITENLLKVLVPESLSANRRIAVISVGKNSWGFPKPEVLEMLAKYNVKVLRTDEAGDVEIATDGESGKILVK